MTRPLEIWGGLECSVVRIGSEVRNQLVETGHVDRAERDIDLIAELGVKTLRYPVLWDTVEQRSGALDWRWHDKALTQLRDHNIEVIAGLVHHGSGPARTNLLDPAFPELLAEYGMRVARRYPWISTFTPINEPLTTARLSGLYGLWQPHSRDENICFRMTAAQCRATALTMRAIRSVTPSARLIQTEDVGRIFSTTSLKEQASYENERRWLSLDLLTGKVDSSHHLLGRLVDAGVVEAELQDLVANPCPPDMIGIDYYLTSDRFLDDRPFLFPTEPVGGNGRQRYVDVAAARVDSLRNESRLSARLTEAWDRYRIPLAVTEIHNGSTRDEQIRWFLHSIDEVAIASMAGVDVRAVTAWALFGSYDWDSLLTKHAGYYEPGAFDIRCGKPRPTALAHVLKALSSKQVYDHPVLDRSGWWQADHDGDARVILLRGPKGWTEAIAQRCNIRRLMHSLAPPISSRFWAQVDAIECETETKMCAVYEHGGSLELLIPTELNSQHAADAFLDLLVDGLAGRFVLVGAMPANQYEIVPLPPRSPDGAASRRLSPTPDEVRLKSPAVDFRRELTRD